MKSYLVFILVAASFYNIYSQEKLSVNSINTPNSEFSIYNLKNNFNINILGNVSYISVQYERLFFLNPKSSITVGLGVGYSSEFVIIGDPPEEYITYPMYITFNLIHREKHFFNIGIGSTIIKNNQNRYNYIYTVLSYRMRTSKKFNFGPFFNIPINKHDNEILYSPIGFSLGICF